MYSYIKKIINTDISAAKYKIIRVQIIVHITRISRKNVYSSIKCTRIVKTQTFTNGYKLLILNCLS
jgi:hypothetical protein